MEFTMKDVSMALNAQAREDSSFVDLDYESYQREKSNGVYLQAFENAFYENAVNYSANYLKLKLELNNASWQ